jgi:hypothetical protein
MPNGKSESRFGKRDRFEVAIEVPPGPSPGGAARDGRFGPRLSENSASVMI